MVAKSLQNLLDNPVVAPTFDRAAPTEEALQIAEDAWGIDLINRNPSPAFGESDGELVYRGTDLDMFTVMSVLGDRGAVINIPTFTGLRPRSHNPEQWVISPDNRHGKLYGVVSNSKTNAFSVQIFDQNVVQNKAEGQSSGAWRRFSVVDDLGEWHDGWRTIEFLPTSEESNFIDEYGLESAPNTVTFHNWVHPNLSGAFHGARYLSTKILENRVTEELAHYARAAKELRSQGITLVEDAPPSPYAGPKTTAPGDKVKVDSVEAKLVLPERFGEFQVRGIRKDGEPIEFNAGDVIELGSALRYAERHASELRTHQRRLRARLRAVEYGFLNHGLEADGTEKPVGWDTPEWRRGYRETARSRTDWNALPLSDDAALLYRVRSVTATVK